MTGGQVGHADLAALSTGFHIYYVAIQGTGERSQETVLTPSDCLLVTAEGIYFLTAFTELVLSALLCHKNSGICFFILVS